MTPHSYLDYRRNLFYTKTDELIIPGQQRHHIEWSANRSSIRRFSMCENDYAMMAEARVVDEVSKTGVPVIPMKVVFEPLQSYQRMGIAEGIPIAELETQEEKNTAYSDLGRLLAVLHTVGVSGYGLINPFESRLTGVKGRWLDHILTKLDDHIQYAVRQDLIGEAEAHYIEKVIREFCYSQHIWSTECATLLHGDLSDNNVFVKHDAVTAILDWEDALGGDPIFDLANWATFIAHPYTVHHHLLDSYFRYQVKPADFDIRFSVYYLRIALSKLVQLHRYGVKDLTLAQQRVETALINVPKT